VPLERKDGREGHGARREGRGPTSKTRGGEEGKAREG